MEHEGKALAADETDTHHHRTAGIASVHVRAVITWLAIFPLAAVGMSVLAVLAPGWPPVLCGIRPYPGGGSHGRILRGAPASLGPGAAEPSRDARPGAPQHETHHAGSRTAPGRMINCGTEEGRGRGRGVVSPVSRQEIPALVPVA